MRNNLPISPKKKFKYSITFQSFDEESLEIGETDDKGYEVEETTDTIGEILYEANTTYGIYMPVSFGIWESTEPEENRDFWEKGIRKYYALHITNEDGTEISQEESDFISFLLSDGRFEINKFRDYAVGGIVLGAVALGVGALITYFYFKGKKPKKDKFIEEVKNAEQIQKIEDSKQIEKGEELEKKVKIGRAKSVTHTINGKDRKFPIKDAWKREHSLENKSQKYEVPQGDRKPVKYEMGGDASEHYHEVEYGEGGVARAKDVIMNKIGYNEDVADYFVSKSEKFAIWLADAVLKNDILDFKGSKEEYLKSIYASSSRIGANYGGGIREILDWLQHPVTPKQDLRKLTFNEALEKAREWHNELQVLGGDIDFTEPETNQILKKYPVNADGIEYYWVFIPSNYCDLESSRMGHCGRTGYGNKLISLRSVKPYGKGHTISDSHVTIAYGVNDGIFYQVKGKKNNKPSEKYFPYIFDLIKSMVNNDVNKLNSEKIENINSEIEKINKGIENISNELALIDTKSIEFKAKTDAISFLVKQKGELEKSLEKIDLDFNFNGFGSEYQSSEDYGFEDMTNEELRELYELKPSIFNDAESVLSLYDAGVITDLELQTNYDPNSNKSIFSSFGNQIKLYQRGIILNKPSTTFEIEKECADVKDLLIVDRDIPDSVIEDVLCGDIYDYLGGWDYYYDNPTYLIDNLNKENTEKVIDEIVRITGLEKSVVTENGIEHYLNGDDEDFSTDDFDNIIRSLASAQNSADANDYKNHIYKTLKSSLEELGYITSLNSEGLKMTIDLSNIKTDEQISEQMDEYEFAEVSDLFAELVARGDFDLPSFSIDDRYRPYGSSKDFNEYISYTDLEQGYKKGGYLRPKTNNKNKKTKIKNMKPSQRKLAQGGTIETTGISKEDYFLVVKNWVYFTFNYPMGFVKNAFNSNHLEEKFSSSYERYGSVGVLINFWANLDGENRRILSLWIKNNYFNGDKTKLQSISDDNYAKIITHWNMFCFNYPYGFVKKVFNNDHYEVKFTRSYEKASSTGAVNYFFTELSGDNQKLLTDWVFDNYKGETFKDGGRVTTNDEIIEEFLTSERELKVGNLSTHFNKYDNQILLRNYGTLIATRKGNDVEITNVKYSKTTTIITNKVKNMALRKRMNVKHVDKFADGGSIERYNLHFNYNPSNLANEDAELIVSKYTKDWKHNNDWDEVSFYVFGLTEGKANELKSELNGYDTYNVEIDKSRYAYGGEIVWVDNFELDQDKINRAKYIINYNLRNYTIIDNKTKKAITSFPTQISAVNYINTELNKFADGGLVVKNNTDLQEVAKYMTNAVKKHRWDLKDLIYYFEKENNFDYKHRVKIWEEMNGYEMPKTYNNIYEMLKRISEANGSKFADGGEAGKTMRDNYDALVGRVGDEFYFLDSIFIHNDGFKGATGTNVMPVSKAYYEYATSEDGILERYMDAMGEDEWISTLGLNREDFEDEDDLIKAIEDGIYQLYYVGELNPFEEVGSDMEEQLRALPQFASSEEYPIFEVIGGGRIFDKETKFDEIYNQELFDKIKEIEEFAKGGQAGKKPLKSKIKKKDPKIVRQYFEDKPYSYADGGEAGEWKIGDKFKVIKGIYGDYNSPRYANQEFEVINIRDGKYIDARNKRGNTETFDAKNIEKIYYSNGGSTDDVEQNFKVGNIVELSESGWDNENYHDFFEGVDNVKLVITDVYKSKSEHQGFDEGVGMALYSTKRFDNNEIVPFDLYDYELEYVSKGKKFAGGGEAGGWKIGDKFRVLKGIYGDYNSPRYANQEFEVINIRDGKYIDARNKRGNTETFNAKNIEKIYYSKGGSTDLEYSDILNVLKSKIDDSIDEINSEYENSDSFTGEEVEHESRSGFIPFTDGGYEARWFENISHMFGTGYTLPTKPLDDEMNRQIDYNLQLAKENFIKNYPEIVEELGEENIDYNSLYEAGYESEAEELSNDEMEMMLDDTIMMQVTAYYYSPENHRGIEDKHTIRLFGDVNLESPYHRQGNLDDSYDIDFTFDSIAELEEKMDAGLKEIISWFDGDMYNDSTSEMKVRRMAKGGNLGEFNEAIVTDLYDKINGKKIRTQNQKSIKEAIESANENSKYYNGYAEVYIGAIFVGFSKNGNFKYSSRYKGDKFAKGGSVKGIKKKAEKLLEDSISFRFKSTDMGSGWLFKLESPLNRSVFNLLDEQLYIDEFSPDDMGIEDYDDLSKEEQDYYYEDWKQELFQSSFEAFKEKNMKHLDDFIEYIQQAKEYQDEMNEYAGGGEAGDDIIVIHTSMKPELFIKKHKLTNYNFEIDESDYENFYRINFETYPKNKNFLKDKSIKEFYYEPIDTYDNGGMLGESARLEYVTDAYASYEMQTKLKKKLNIKTDALKDNYVISFAYTDYGGDFLDKVAIAYFSENYPKNIIKENAGYNGENAYVFGEPAKEWIETTENYPLGFEDIEDFYYEKQTEQEQEDFNYFLDEISDKYEFDKEEALEWLNENRGGYYGMTTQGLDFSYEDLIQELVREGIIEKIEEDEEYAEGGEVQEWMDEALESLIEETGNDDLEITIVSNDGNEFYCEGNDSEYRVFKSEDYAEEVAVEQVRGHLEGNAEYFNQDWLMNYIDGRDFFEEALTEMNDGYVQDIESETYKTKYANRLIDELVENGLMDEDDAESDNAEELADDLKYDYVALLTQEKLEEGNDGLDYFINNFGEKETYKMVMDNNLIDIDEASKDAVQTDGIAHFLSSYDGETLYLSDDCVAYRTN